MRHIQHGRYYSFIKRTWILFFIGWIAVTAYLVAVSINLFGLFGPLPGFKVLENPKNDLASEVYAADGVLLGKYFEDNRSPVEYGEISPNVIHALLATEDVRFRDHSGIDLRSMARVFFKSIVLFQDEGGGSTLSQQLAKNLYNMRRSENTGRLSRVPLLGTLVMKTKEWITAIRLEQNFTKEEILTMYLNTVDFGSNAFGIRVAARTFFQKSPATLTAPEAALLVGLLKSPSLYSPVRHPERARRRRNTVLSRMRTYGYLSAADYQKVSATPLQLNYEVENPNTGLAAYFRAYLRKELLTWAESHDVDLYTDGLKIYTTIDSRLQQHAEAAVDSQMAVLQQRFDTHWQGRSRWIDRTGTEIPDYIQTAATRTPHYRQLYAQYGDEADSIWQVLNTPVPMQVFSWQGAIDTVLSPMDSIRYYKQFLQAGLMAMDPSSGHVRAWVGGIDFAHFQYDHVRQGRRQPASVFKPIVYAAAIDYGGYAPCDKLPDIPPVFPEYGNWMVRNYGRTYSDTLLTLRQAMAQSKNTVPAYLIKRMGVPTIVEYAKRLGITSPLRELPSISLGTEPVSLYEMVGAYSTFANRGIWTKPLYVTRIEDRNDNVLEDFSPVTREVMPEEKAYLMLHMLRGALEEDGGSARGLYRYDVVRNNYVGAKTGTSQNYADGWFVGITNDLAAGVWVGGDDMAIHFRDGNGSGSRTALPIWGIFMDKVYADTTLNLQKGFPERPPHLRAPLNCDALPGDSTHQYIVPSADSLENEGFL